MIRTDSNRHREKKREVCRDYWIWAAFLVVLLFTSVIRLRLAGVPLERDEGEYAYTGQLLLRGIWPYQAPSLYKYKLPGIYFVYALIFALFGETAAAIRVGLLVANIGTIVLLFVLARRLFDSFTGVVTAAAYSILSMSQSVFGVFAHGEHFVVLAAVGGGLLLLIAIDSYRWWNLFLSGLLFGLAYLIRQHGAAFAVFAVGYFVLSQVRRPDIRWVGILFRTAVLCLGMAVPLVLTCVVFLVAGVFGRFYFWTFVYSRKYLAMLPFSEGVIMFTDSVTWIVQSSILIWILAGGGLVALLWWKKARSQIPFVLVFLVFSFISICPGFYFREHYFVLFLPAVALLAGIGSGFVRDFFERRQLGSVGKVMPTLLTMVVLFHAVYQQRNFFFIMSPTTVSRATYSGNPFCESLEIARYIKENSSKNDLVAILGSEPQILFYAQRHSATGYTDTYELMKKHDYALQMQKQMIREIESARPKFLVFVKIPLSWLVGPNSEKMIFEWFRSYQEKYYKLVGVIDIISQDQTIYRWDKDAVGYQPRSKYWITVFMRKEPQGL